MKLTKDNIFQIDTSRHLYIIDACDIRLYDCIITQKRTSSKTPFSQTHHDQHFGVVIKITKSYIYLAELELKLYINKKVARLNDRFISNKEDFISNVHIAKVVKTAWHYKSVDRFSIEYDTKCFVSDAESQRVRAFITKLELDIAIASKEKSISLIERISAMGI